MTTPSLWLLAPFLMAFASWVSEQSVHGRWARRLCLPMQGTLALVLLYVLWSHNHSVAQACMSAFAWLTVTVSLWRGRHRPEVETTRASGAVWFALQGSLWLAVLAPHATGVLTGFCAGGICLTAFADTAGAAPSRIFHLHRGADVLATAAVLVWTLWATDLAVVHMRVAAESDDALLYPIAGLTAPSWLLGLFSTALLVRALAAALASSRAPSAALAISVTLAANTFAFARFFALGKVVVLGLACITGLALAWAFVRVAFIATLCARLCRSLRLVGLFVVGINQWLFATVLLQAPVVAVDACARVLKLLAGGDIQRYVAVGVVGFAALVFATTRPASRATLHIDADGLTIRAAAGRGAVSSSRLLYDYDFDGDEHYDRVGVGPQAAFVYAAPGTYSVSVTIRDPFWHTSKTLHAKVKVVR